MSHATDGIPGGIHGRERLSVISRAEAERLGVSNVEFHASGLRYSSFGHTFDVVDTRSRLTHLKDPATLVRMFFDHLRPGGRMAVEDIAANPTTLAGTPRIVQSWGRRPD
jgi:2-polyprenyl-3-methyl-5-hydroxy-6-metoxy-1,4-benzoquinol methylase